MAFVKIKKGNKSTSVTEEAYKEYFKNAGWKKESAGKEEQSEDDWDSVTEDDLLEKPVGEMDSDEVKKAAQLMGLSVAGKSTKQLREEIRKKQNNG